MASSLSTCYLVGLLYLLHQVSQSRVTLQMVNISDIGPFCSRKCKNADDQPTDADIPLYKCSCSPSCTVFRDCCFDSPHKKARVSHSRDFVCISVGGHDRYKAVSGCLSNQAAGFCKDGLGHLPPVTSRVTNITYANKFCANCNGVTEDLITWNVELRCSGASTGDRYIYKYGRIWSLNENDGSKAPCKYIILNNDSTSFIESLELRSCTANTRKPCCSSSWRDRSVLDMCRSYEDPVYFRNKAFRNAHCAMCNYMNLAYADCVPDNVKNLLATGVVDSKVTKFCNTRGSDACIQALWDRSKGRHYAFADLLNIHEKGCVAPSGKRCCEGQAFDFRTQRCRKIRN